MTVTVSKMSHCYRASTVASDVLFITSKSIRLDDNINTDYNVHGIRYY